MAAKEAGTLYVSGCTHCGDELTVGWLRDAPSPVFFQPHEAAAIRQRYLRAEATMLETRGGRDPGRAVEIAAVDVAPRMATVDDQHIGQGPLRCRCGRVTLSFNPATGRARVEWPDGTPEPSLGNINLH